MHVLLGVRRNEARRILPELRRGACTQAPPTREQAGRESRVDSADLDASGLRCAGVMSTAPQHGALYHLIHRYHLRIPTFDPAPAFASLSHPPRGAGGGWCGITPVRPRCLTTLCVVDHLSRHLWLDERAKAKNRKAAPCVASGRGVEGHSSMRHGLDEVLSDAGTGSSGTRYLGKC
jgi:hypothetical protein